MRQKRRHTWTVSFVEVPLGPLRAGGAPESTKQPRYPGTEEAGDAGSARRLVPELRVGSPLAHPCPAGPLTVTGGDVAVAPVDALLRLGHVAPRLHVAIWVPAGGEGVQILRPANPKRPRRARGAATLRSACSSRADGGKTQRASRAGVRRSAEDGACAVLPPPCAPRPRPGLGTPLSSGSGTSISREGSSRSARSLLLPTAAVSLNPKSLGHR